jgi:hypothetical protein
VGSRLLITENYSVFYDFNVNSKCIESVPSRARIDKREEFPDIISVGHDINRTDVI